MLRKNKPRNPLTSRVNADLGAKCEKGAQNAKEVTQSTPL